MHPQKSRIATGKLSKIISILADATPKNQEDQLIERLLKLPSLNGWESLFLREIKKTKTLGTKQREKLEQIAARRLEPEIRQMELPLGDGGEI